MIDTIIFTILRTARNAFFDLSSKLSPDTVLPIAILSVGVIQPPSNPGICVTRRFSAETLDTTKLLEVFDTIPTDPSGVKKRIPRNMAMRNRENIQEKIRKIRCDVEDIPEQMLHR